MSSQQVMVLGFFLFAAVASLSLPSHAIAASEGDVCATIGNISCDKGLWCDHEPDSCGVDHPKGVCVKAPDFCIAVIVEVCGCDGKVYNNDCERQRAGVHKKKDGAC